MSVLTDSEIRYLAISAGLIANFDEASLEGASYDMRLGRQYVVAGEIRTLTDESPSYVLQPGDFLVLTTWETLDLPLDVVGHNGIMSPWAKRGVVSLFSPQIDPGFRGFLTVPVFNAGDAPITLALRERMFTIEFVWTSVPASYGWAERHGEQTTVRISATPITTRPNLAEIGAVIAEHQVLSREVQALEARVAITENRMTDVLTNATFRLGKTQVLLAILALLVAALALPPLIDWLQSLNDPTDVVPSPPRS